MRGQMDFDGRELQAVDVTIPSIGTRTTQQLDLEPDQLHQGDEVKVELVYRVTHVNHGAPIDGSGMEKGEFGRTYVLSPVKDSVKVVAHLSREDREAAWQAQHTA